MRDVTVNGRAAKFFLQESQRGQIIVTLIPTGVPNEYKTFRHWYSSTENAKDVFSNMTEADMADRITKAESGDVTKDEGITR